MKISYFFMALLIVSCSENAPEIITPIETSTIQTEDSIISEEPSQEVQTYSNLRFKYVTVEKLSEHTFLIKGKGQIFEANFNWIVEDGHDELKKGFEMTDAGAPEWGNFSFTVNIEKKRANSTLHLVLFETSAEDGSRKHELPILLY